LSLTKWIVFGIYFILILATSLMSKDAGFIIWAVLFLVFLGIVVLVGKMKICKILSDLFIGFLNALDSTTFYTFITFCITMWMFKGIEVNENVVYAQLFVALFFGAIIPTIIKAIRKYFKL
jgi:hypothetical protein